MHVISHTSKGEKFKMHAMTLFSRDGLSGIINSAHSV